MAEAATRLPVKTEDKTPDRQPTPSEWRPLETLRREVDRLFDSFGGATWPLRRSVFSVEPFWQRELNWGAVPAVDVVERDKAYEVTAELPGMDEKNIELTAINGSLVIKGEKKEEKEEKKKDFYLSERRYGSFERRFQIPDGVDASKIEATFKKGVLTISLPKKPEAQKPKTKIEIKAA